MDIESILAELSLEIGLPTLTLSNSGTCSILIDDHMRIDVEAAEARDNVRIFGVLTTLASISDSELYKSFLEANLYSLDGNIRIAIDAGALEVIMFTKLDMLHLDYEVFFTALEEFVNEYEIWLEKIAKNDIQQVDLTVQGEESTASVDENPLVMRI